MKLNNRQTEVFLYINKHPGVKPGEICKGVKIGKTNLSPILKFLENNNLVSFKFSKHNKKERLYTSIFNNEKHKKVLE